MLRGGDFQAWKVKVERPSGASSSVTATTVLPGIPSSELMSWGKALKRGPARKPLHKDLERRGQRKNMEQHFWDCDFKWFLQQAPHRLGPVFEEIAKIVPKPCLAHWGLHQTSPKALPLTKPSQPEAHAQSANRHTFVCGLIGVYFLDVQEET